MMQRVLAHGLSGLYAGWPSPAKLLSPICFVLLSFLLPGCARPSVHAPVTLTLLEEWTTKTFSAARGQELLAAGASGPDVYGIDVIWTRILNENFIDLKPYFTGEISAQFPAIAASYTVDNKLMAMAYRADMGLLFYRTDLLRNYGYREPPKTWDELEIMAARIQAGERAKGKKEFWGLVWQGGAAEALTCNALEWQAAEGGGQIIEKDKTISVNNPHAIRAWQRASRWVGSISPRSVIGYEEWDAQNVWIAGDAVFMRNWPTAFVDSQATGSPIRNKFDMTLLPGGKAGRVGTLGGAGLGVSRFSTHRREAVELVRYLSRKDIQVKRSSALAVPPTLPELYDMPEVLERNPRFALLSRAFRNGIVSRPSNVTGEKYQDVTDAYIQAVHSVLTGEKIASAAAVDLEKDLIRITGFKKGPPLDPPDVTP